uniref:Uncharacterized protein n=1 Tax=Salix viminalis TaxID=40686 RepID=A0A6N2MM75_SALVM
MNVPFYSYNRVAVRLALDGVVANIRTQVKDGRRESGSKLRHELATKGFDHLRNNGGLKTVCGKETEDQRKDAKLLRNFTSALKEKYDHLREMGLLNP